MIRHQLPALGSPAWLDMDHRDIIRDGEAATPPERSEPLHAARGSGSPGQTCSACEGEGWQYVMWMFAAPWPDKVNCSECNGTGRRPVTPNDRTERPEAERNK